MKSSKSHCIPGHEAPRTDTHALYGYVVDGVIAYQLLGEGTAILSPGQAFFEPANTTVVRFDNESSSNPATFVAVYLPQADVRELIELVK